MLGATVSPDMPEKPDPTSRSLIVRAVDKNVEDTGSKTADILEAARFIEDTEFLLDNSPTLNPRSRASLTAVIEYLKMPTGNIADLKTHSLALGVVALEDGHIPVVGDLNRRFVDFLYAYQNAKLQEALSSDPQQMMEITGLLQDLQRFSGQALILPSGVQRESALRSDFEAFLGKNEMRLRTSGEVPSASSSDSVPVIAAMEEFLKTGEGDAAIDRALAYLRSPTGDGKDLMKLGDDLAELIAMTYMGDGPPEIEFLYTHILRLQFEHERTKLRTAMTREPQDMKEVSTSLVLTRNLAVSSKSTDPMQLQELEEFLNNFEIKQKSEN